MRRIFKRFREDRGSAESVAFIVIIPLLVTFVMAFIDIGIYFNEKNTLTAAAQSGARDAAIFGGNGSHGGSKKIKDKYAKNQGTAEDTAKKALMISIGKDKYVDSDYQVDCGVFKKGNDMPEQAIDAKVGESVGCTITKDYDSSIAIGPFKMTPSQIRAVGVSVSEVSAK